MKYQIALMWFSKDARKRQSFPALSEILVVLECCWIAQCSWFFPSVCPQPDAACLEKLPHTLPKSRCKRWHIGDKWAAKTSTIYVLPLRHVRQCEPLQFHAYPHQVQARPTACCQCQSTNDHNSSHCIVRLPFFWVSLPKPYQYLGQAHLSSGCLIKHQFRDDRFWW